MLTVIFSLTLFAFVSGGSVLIAYFLFDAFPTTTKKKRVSRLLLIGLAFMVIGCVGMVTYFFLTLP